LQPPRRATLGRRGISCLYAAQQQGACQTESLGILELLGFLSFAAAIECGAHRRNFVQCCNGLQRSF
jgi:hypothetical protein